MPNWRGAIRQPPARLKPRDRSRIARALEVVEATGPFADRLASRRIAAAAAAGAIAARCFWRPSARQLYARIDARFDAMLEAGALDEVRGVGGAAVSIRCCRR